MLTMKNDLHRTEIKVKRTPKEMANMEDKFPWRWTNEEKAFIRKVRNALCPNRKSGCCLGDFWGRW